MRSPVAALHARHHSACAELAKLASVFRITQTGTLPAVFGSQRLLKTANLELSREGEEQKQISKEMIRINK